MLVTWLEWYYSLPSNNSIPMCTDLVSGHLEPCLYLDHALDLKLGVLNPTSCQPLTTSNLAFKHHGSDSVSNPGCFRLKHDLPLRYHT